MLVDVGMFVALEPFVSLVAACERYRSSKFTLLQYTAACVAHLHSPALFVLHVQLSMVCWHPRCTRDVDYCPAVWQGPLFLTRALLCGVRQVTGTDVC